MNADAPDLLVIGSGVAGLTAAVEAKRLGLRVLVVTKAAVDDSSTRWAQGGIGVVLRSATDGDSVDAHVRDTLTAGAGLCDERTVRAILAAGPAAVDALQRRGAAFDRDGSRLACTREGGHSAFRVIHAGGDATGAEVERALVTATGTGRVPVLERHTALALCRDGQGVTGVRVLDGDGHRHLLSAGAVLLATGGAGQLYASTTNPEVATADGLALALRAGARLMDVEFVQFHPTALWTGPAGGQRPLVTEAVRGEGAVLVDRSGARVMAGVHPLADMAPRDVVATAITRRLNETGATHVFLDAAGVDGFRTRFPTVYASCRAIGVDPTREPIPVAPAAHYLCGGVAVDLDGRTGVPGLYAAGEVARSGLHGANRLASNSLLEGLVVGTRVARAAAAEHRIARATGTQPTGGVRTVDRHRLQEMASRRLGLGRDADGLADVDSMVDGTAPRYAESTADVEDAALTLLARAVAAAAAARLETRGCHVRHDAPATSESWRRSLTVRLATPDDDGSLVVQGGVPMAATR